MLKEYIQAFTDNQWGGGKKQAIKEVNLIDFPRPLDGDILLLANKYHYGLGVRRNLLLAFDMYNFVHTKNCDPEDHCVPVTSTSLLQFIECSREMLKLTDEVEILTENIWANDDGFDDAEVSQYLYETELLKIACAHGFPWALSYILEELARQRSLVDEKGSWAIDGFSNYGSMLETLTLKIGSGIDKFLIK